MSEVVRRCWDLRAEGDADVVVVGGGPSGIAAAIAAARHGAKTSLIERFGCVGGMGTTGLVGPFMTSFGVDGEERLVLGVFQELVDRMVELGGAVDPGSVSAGSEYTSFIIPAHHNCTPFDPEVLKYVAMEMLLEAGVHVRLHTRCVDVIQDAGSIKGVVSVDKAGHALTRGKCFVDASGDADLVALAGGRFTKGRSEDGRMQPVTMFFRVGGVDDAQVERHVKAHPNEPLFAALVREAADSGDWPGDNPRRKVGLYRLPRAGEWRVNTSRVLGIDATDPHSLTKAEIEGRRQVMLLMQFFRKYCPGMENAYLIDTAAHIGVRETRIIEGKYRLTQEDVRRGRCFEDGIARYAFFMDVHNPAGAGQEVDQGRGEYGKHWLMIEKGNYYEIPFRCLLPTGFMNLIVAGRSISTDRMAYGTTRVMPPCFATGQAAGVAAALAVQSSTSLADLDGVAVRKVLQADGCYV